MLQGTKVENTLFGGPAFGLLMRGDILVKIDGVPVSEGNILSCLRGTDIPGSKVTFTVRRVKRSAHNPTRMVPKKHSVSDSLKKFHDGDDMEEVEISITRIETAEIADRKRMFDLFTTLQVH
jgi:hypothetical protein